jgi:PAS domain S-box-containing protein
MVVIILSRVAFDNSQDYTRQAEESRTIIQLYNKIELQLRGGMVYSPSLEKITTSDIFGLYKEDLNSIHPTVKQLQSHVKDEKEQVAIVDSLERIVQSLLPLLRLKNMAQIIASEEADRIEQLKQVHVLIEKGLALEQASLEKKRVDLMKANNQNSVYTLGLSILAIVIVTAIFFQQFFLSKRSQWLEGFLESILNTTQNGIVYLRAARGKGGISDFKVEYANQTVQTLLGVDPDAVIGKHLAQLDPQLKDKELFSRLASVVETGKATQFEQFFQTKHGERWIYVSAAKRDDGVTVAFHNISELKHYEQELQKNIAALEQSNRELEEYAYAASHDLQEPLRKIRTFGGILQDTQYHKLDERGKQQLEKIIHSTERMSLLIKDLLSFSSLKEKEEFTTTDLNAIFDNVLRDLEVVIEQKKAIITHDTLPEIQAIPVQINQLFYNLVNNALKFSKEDIPLHLDVSCKTVKAEEVKDVPALKPATSYYEIVFSDNGIGFSQEFATQIFGLFKRLNDKVRYAGSGIGLSLCKKVVANHNGVILANGKENVGAQFYIYLPVRKQVTGASLPETE